MGNTKPRMSTRHRIGWVAQIFASACGALAGLFSARFLFRLLLANPANPVTSVVLTLTRPLLFPWDHLWPPTPLPIVTVERATLAGLGFYVTLGLVLSFLGQAVTRSEEKGT
jgi:H+/Cl- antiporter ClcA